MTATWYIFVQTGPTAGAQIQLPASGVISMGRKTDNAICIEDPTISRHHAQISIQGNVISIQDLGSANGTFVNGRRISGAIPLHPGDVIGLGDKIRLTFDDAIASDKTIVRSPRQVAAPIAVSSIPPTAAPVRSASGLRNVLIGGILAVVGIVAIAAIAVIGWLFFRPDSTATPEPSAVAAVFIPTDTPIPATPTPYPTYTPYPTVAPTNTPYPTYTPYPTVVAPTNTPYPTYTPFPKATATPRVIVVTVTVAAPTSPPQPTATITPVRPKFFISLGNNIHYEPWGAPLDANRCSGPYNDHVQMKRFYFQVILTNYSDTTIDEGWGPSYTSANGDNLPQCVYHYDNLVVSPGESTDVTYVTYLQPNDYVTKATFKILGQTQSICFNPAGGNISCP